MNDTPHEPLPALPDGYAVRHASRDDLPGTAPAVPADESATVGEVITTADDLAANWEYADWVFERDSWVVLDRAGRVCAYGWCHTPNPETDPDGQLWVAPGDDRDAVTAHLMARILRRAADMAAGELTREAPALGLWCAERDDFFRRHFEAAGARCTRAFWRMSIAADDVPARPPLPEGIVLREMRRPDDEHAWHDAFEEAFVDHFRWFCEPFDEWHGRVFAHPGYDPSFWIVACEGDEIAGILRCQAEDDTGHVDTLAVRKPWRGRGLGLALLVHGFHLLKARGLTPITLGVDAGNETGAVALYERAGMTVRQRFDFYEKPLAAG